MIIWSRKFSFDFQDSSKQVCFVYFHFNYILIIRFRLTYWTSHDKKSDDYLGRNRFSRRPCEGKKNKYMSITTTIMFFISFLQTHFSQSGDIFFIHFSFSIVKSRVCYLSFICCRRWADRRVYYCLIKMDIFKNLKYIDTTNKQRYDNLLI
jgi:hypothetical protein